MPGKNQPSALVLCAALGLLPACGPETLGEGAATDAASSTAIGKTDGGLFYSSLATGGGTGSCTPDGSNGYRAMWANAVDFFCGRGWNIGSTTRTVTWAGTFNDSGPGIFGLYGWSTNPVVEYYVMEAGQFGSYIPGTMMGTYTTDGSTYRLYRAQRVNQPCITGSACTFWQYLAIRQTPRTSGSITVQNHFSAWKAVGMYLGTLNYQLLLTEAWGGATGSATAKIADCCSSSTDPVIVPR